MYARLSNHSHGIKFWPTTSQIKASVYLAFDLSGQQHLKYIQLIYLRTTIH